MTSESQNISPKINFRKLKYITESTFESQNISPKVDFQKSKIITES